MEKYDVFKESNVVDNRVRKTKHFKRKRHHGQGKQELPKHHQAQATPTKKSVKKVVFLLPCLMLLFFVQNGILASLTNTSRIKSPIQMISMNLVVCVIIFFILLAINKQPQQIYASVPVSNNVSAPKNNIVKMCKDSKQFFTSIFCCCYCCFNYPEEDHCLSTSIDDTLRKTFLIPLAPWIHAITIFLNVR